MTLKGPVFPNRVMTVIIRDDSPMIHCVDSPSYRAVRVPLTDEQIEMLKLRHVGSVGSIDYYEAISRAIIECGESS